MGAPARFASTSAACACRRGGAARAGARRTRRGRPGRARTAASGPAPRPQPATRRPRRRRGRPSRRCRRSRPSRSPRPPRTACPARRPPEPSPTWSPSALMRLHNRISQVRPDTLARRAVGELDLGRGERQVPRLGPCRTSWVRRTAGSRQSDLVAGRKPQKSPRPRSRAEQRSREVGELVVVEAARKMRRPGRHSRSAGTPATRSSAAGRCLERQDQQHRHVDRARPR